MDDKTELFIFRAVQRWENKYDYSQVKYIDCKTPIIVICKKHGPFEENASAHLSKNNGIIERCDKCRGGNNLFGRPKKIVSIKWKIYNSVADAAKQENLDIISLNHLLNNKINNISKIGENPKRLKASGFVPASGWYTRENCFYADENSTSKKVTQSG